MPIFQAHRLQLRHKFNEARQLRAIKPYPRWVSPTIMSIITTIESIIAMIEHNAWSRRWPPANPEMPSELVFWYAWQRTPAGVRLSIRAA